MSYTLVDATPIGRDEWEAHLKELRTKLRERPDDEGIRSAVRVAEEVVSEYQKLEGPNSAAAD
jgi:hypothetical protein